MKQILNERVSDVLFHFTTLSSLAFIVKDNALLATPSGANASDYKLGVNTMDNEYRLKYPFYVCFSRTPSSAVGYPAMRRNKYIEAPTEANKSWLDMVRLKIDGRYLNQQYRGKPVNYFDPNYQALATANSIGWPKVNMNPIRHRLTQGSQDFISEPFDKPYESPDGTKHEGFSFGTFTVYHLNSKGSIDYKRPLLDNNGTPMRVKSQSEFTDFLNTLPSQERTMFGIAPDGTPTSNKSNDNSPNNSNTTRNSLLRMMSEYEDRIYSRSQYIPYADRFIERIDILIDDISNINELKNKRQEVYNLIMYAVSKFGNKVHLFNNNKSFDRCMDTYDLLHNYNASFDHDKFEQSHFEKPTLSYTYFKAIAMLLAYYSYSLPNHIRKDKILEIINSLFNDNTFINLTYDGIKQKLTKPMLKDDEFKGALEDTDAIEDLLYQYIINIQENYDNKKTNLSSYAITISQKIKVIKNSPYKIIFGKLVAFKLYCEKFLQEYYKTNNKLDTINKTIQTLRYKKLLELRNEAQSKMINEAYNNFYNLYFSICRK